PPAKRWSFLLAVSKAFGREFPAKRDFADLSLGTLKTAGKKVVFLYLFQNAALQNSRKCNAKSPRP
ncbi:MAG: hypothetical protein Q8P42_13320, partial [Gallionella sp.]|nr:hypothetical protein [Gallionella sp.]